MHDEESLELKGEKIFSNGWAPAKVLCREAWRLKIVQT